MSGGLLGDRRWRGRIDGADSPTPLALVRVGGMRSAKRKRSATVAIRLATLDLWPLRTGDAAALRRLGPQLALRRHARRHTAGDGPLPSHAWRRPRRRTPARRLDNDALPPRSGRRRHDLHRRTTLRLAAGGGRPRPP